MVRVQGGPGEQRGSIPGARAAVHGDAAVHAQVRPRPPGCLGRKRAALGGSHALVLRSSCEYLRGSCSDQPHAAHARVGQAGQPPLRGAQSSMLACAVAIAGATLLLLSAPCCANAPPLASPAPRLAGQQKLCGCARLRPRQVARRLQPSPGGPRLCRGCLPGQAWRAAEAAPAPQHQPVRQPAPAGRALVPMHRDLRLAGQLPPLDAPHHMRADEWRPFREGVVVASAPGAGSRLDVGLDLVRPRPSRGSAHAAPHRACRCTSVRPHVAPLMLIRTARAAVERSVRPHAALLMLRITCAAAKAEVRALTRASSPAPTRLVGACRSGPGATGPCFLVTQGRLVWEEDRPAVSEAGAADARRRLGGLRAPPPAQPSQASTQRGARRGAAAARRPRTRRRRCGRARA